MKRSRKRLAAAALAVVAVAAGGEVGARVMATRDVDGNVFVRSTRLRPFRPPIERTRAILAEYDEQTVVMYDERLGWVPRPSGVYRDGMYTINSAGLRTLSGEEYDLEPADGRTRIGFFGDSYVEGADVAYDDSFAHLVEVELREAGHDVEVLNFACGGWGIDQAYLRWEELGADYGLDAVVVGFQAENAMRNLNVLRPLYFYGTGLPFSKPRFVLDGDALALVNVPAIPPDAVPEVMAGLGTWDLREHERFYDEAHYGAPWYGGSRALGFLLQRLERRRARSEAVQIERYASDGEAGRLVEAIFGRFAAEADEAGAAFSLVHIPKRADLRRVGAGSDLVYADLFADLGSKYSIHDPTDAMLSHAQDAGLGSLFVSSRIGHYSAVGNGIVARVIASDLAPTLRNDDR
ncbi:MAG: SGNH/GDSL hydrolase family protein [Planctomycetota bacterium]